jgi:hypothetical protein
MAGVVDELRIDGFRLRESVLFHRPSRTLVVADLVHNVGRPPHGWTKMYARTMGFYDRAALIALPPEMRLRYMQLLAEGLPSGSQGLLVTLDYDQALLPGPPFSVADAEVRQGFAGCEVQALEAVEIIEQSAKFVQAGATSLLERVYRIQL